MSARPDQQLGFRARRVPLSVAGVYADGAAAVSVVRQLLAAEPARLRALRGVATTQCVVLLGPEPELPWADAVTYLGMDVRAPRLLLPTYYEPAVPFDLLERCIVSSAQTPALIALLPGPGRLIALGDACVPEPDALRAWLQRVARAQ